MLVIGNLANRCYSHGERINSVDIIYEEGEEELVLKKLDITAPIAHSNIVSDTYFANSKYYTLYSTKKIPVFRLLLKQYFVKSTDIKVAPPLLTFAWARMKSSFKHTSLLEWDDHMKTCSTLYHKYVRYTTDMTFHYTNSVSASLAVCGAMGRTSTFRFGEPLAYSTFTEESLYSLFRLARVSIYWNILIEGPSGKKIPSKALWDKLTHSDRINAVLEKFYVETTNEFLIPELQHKISTNLSTESLFKTTIMNFISQPRFSWLKMFVQHNYNEIMDLFDNKFGNTLYEGEKYGLLDVVN